MTESKILEAVFRTLPTVPGHHAPGSELHSLLKQVVRPEVERLFSDPAPRPVRLAPFGDIVFPFRGMGAVDSLNLFDIDEIILFSFYWANRNTYRRALDVGANLGLHSILMSRCGYEVACYEPDPGHFEALRRNLELNGVANVTPFNMAMSCRRGNMEFVRVLGNTTGSHLAGAKANPYGELEKFPVRLEAFRPLLKDVDLVKLDVEGHEPEILTSTVREDWVNTDALVEVENAANAKAIFEHFDAEGVGLFPQKLNWKRARSAKDLPASYREGLLFMSCRERMPW